MASKGSFNLIHEPWIPVITMTGTESLVSLDTLFRDAANYRSLAHEIPTVNVAILRLILAIYYRAHLSEGFFTDVVDALDHWDSQWNRSDLYSPELTSYLSQWDESFDLRSEQRPFFQTPGLRTPKDEVKPISVIIPDVDSDCPLFTMRRGAMTLSAAEAAQFLVHAMSYDYSGIKSGVVGDSRVKGGKAYPMGIGICGWLGATILQGRNLAETILLNYVPLADQSDPIGLPCWELDPPTPDVTEPALVQGRISLLTWPQRRILLDWSGDLVVGVVLTNGDPVDYLSLYQMEAMTPWRYSDTQSKKAKRLIHMPDQLEAGRSMWRSLEGFIPFENQEELTTKFGNTFSNLPAMSVEWLMTVMTESDTSISTDYPITVTMVTMQYGTQMATCSDVIADSLDIPGSAFLIGEEGNAIRAIICEMVAKTDEISDDLKSLHKNLVFAASGATTKSDFAVYQYYQKVDEPFRHWLSTLSSYESQQDAIAAWLSEAVTIARSIGEEMIQNLAPSTWGAPRKDNKGVAIDTGRAASWFNSALNDYLIPLRTGVEKNEEQK